MDTSTELNRKRKIFLLLTIFFTALFGRLVFAGIYGVSFGGDSPDYLKLAENICYHGAYSLGSFPDLIPTIRRAPLYPSFLSLFYFFDASGLDLSKVVFVQCVLDSLVAVMVFCLAERVSSVSISVVSAFVYALHPAAVASSRNILTETLFIFLLTAAVFALVTAVERDKLIFTVISAFLLGLAALCRPLAFFVPFIFAVLLLFFVKVKNKHWQAVVLLAVFALTVAPWLVRCYAVTGKFVLIQSLSSAQFYIASRHDLEQWNEAKMHRHFFAANPEDVYFKKLADARSPAEMIEADAFGRKRAIENISKSPENYAVSRIKSYPYLFLNSFDNFTGINKSFGTLWQSGDWRRLLIKISLLTIFSLVPFALGVLSLVYFQRNAAMMFCAAVWVFNLIVHLPMWIEYRFWLCVVPLQLVSASLGLLLLLNSFEKTLKRYKISNYTINN